MQSDAQLFESRRFAHAPSTYSRDSRRLVFRDVIDATRRLLGDARTWTRIAYLLLAFPLATTYFVVLVTGLALGLGLAIVIVGFGVLAVTLLVWRLFAMIERLLAIHMLGANVRPMSLPNPRSASLVESSRRVLTDPVTWKSLAYLLLEFPFSVFSFTLALALLTTSFSLVAVPIVYAGAWLLDPAFPADAFRHSDFPGPRFAETSPAYQALAVLMVGAIGALFSLASIATLNGLGVLWGHFAELMLGVDESKVQLAAAQTEAKAQHERADSADRSRRELIVNASHELRTPVASISAHVESLLKPEREMDDETRRYLKVVSAETERLATLVDDVLILARADADELHLQVRPVDVEAVIIQVCDALAPLARRERNLSLVRGEPRGLPRAMADRERFAQVLTNLIRNAGNHTPDGGIISVDAMAADSNVKVSVSDTGIGIDADELARVFDRFYRTDDSRARDAGGSGLGLSIVRDLLTAMGGSITAESAPGRGSVFTVSLRREAP